MVYTVGRQIVHIGKGFDNQTNPHLLIVIECMGLIVIRTIGLLITDDYSDF